VRAQNGHSIAASIVELTRKKVENLASGEMRRWQGARRTGLGIAAVRASHKGEWKGLAGGTLLHDATRCQARQDPHIAGRQECGMKRHDGCELVYGWFQSKVAGIGDIDATIANATHTIVKDQSDKLGGPIRVEIKDNDIRDLLRCHGDGLIECRGLRRLQEAVVDRSGGSRGLIGRGG
jgi:hypothetical protein